MVKCGANGSDPESHAHRAPWVSRGAQGLRVPPEMGAVFTPLPSPRVANFGPQPCLTSDLRLVFNPASLKDYTYVKKKKKLQSKTKRQ